MKIRRCERRPDRAERVKIPVPEPGPVDELDAELEGRAGAADEFVFIEPEQLMEQHQRRNRGLTDPDCPDLGRLDHLDRAPLLERACETRRGHPPGRTAADDDDLANRIAHARSRSTKSRCVGIRSAVWRIAVRR